MDDRPGSIGARTLWLEIDTSGDLISGRLGDGRGSRSFAGWLELAAALRHALTADLNTATGPEGGP